MTDRGPFTFVVFGDDWGRHVSSMQHLFAQIIPHHRVVWVNAIGHRVPGVNARDLRRMLGKGRAMLWPARRTPSGAAGVVPHAIVEPKVLPWHLSRPISVLNAWSLRRGINATLHVLGLQGNVVLVTGSPPSAPVVGTLGETASIYFCMDDFLTLPGTTPQMMGPLEQRLLASVDAVVATAQALLDRKRCASGRGYYLPQGVNYEHFATPRPAPPELAALPRPVIGFAGGVSAACDLVTIQGIAEALPHGSVVLVGPIAVSVEPLLRLSNVHLLGPRPYAVLPAYVQAFDVGIVPYRESAWTRAVDPLKLLEYLAAGIPVVASPLPEVQKYADVVTVRALGRPFVDAVTSAVGRAETLVPGRSIARANDWQHRAERFLEIVSEVTARSREERRGQVVGAGSAK